MGYSPGLLLKIGRFRLIGNSSQIFTNKAVLSYKSICTHVVVVSTEFGVSVQNLPKSAMFKTMGYCPGFLLKNGHCQTLANSPENPGLLRLKNGQSTLANSPEID